MAGRRSILALAASLGAASACFWDESSIFYIPDFFFTEPASKVWVRVRHPQLPISFELPANYAAQVEPSLPQLAHPEPAEGKARTVETWGIRPYAKTRFFHYAVEVTVSMFIERDRLGPERVRSLAARPRPQPADLHAFLRDACHPSLAPSLELSRERSVVIGACRGERVRARYLAPAFQGAVFEALVAPVPGRGVLIAEAYVAEAATEEEREEIAPRIVDSIAIEPCNEATLRGLGIESGME